MSLTTVFYPFPRDFLLTEMIQRNFVKEDVENVIMDFLEKNIISEDNQMITLQRSYLHVEFSTLIEKKLIKLLKRVGNDIDNVYYSIMLECQKTKTFQMINQIFKILGIHLLGSEILPSTLTKKIFFLVSQNMQDLTMQNCERIQNDLGNKLQIFVFTSQSRKKGSDISFNPKIDDVISYLLCYLNSDVDMKIPLCIFLANPKQISKMNNLLNIVQTKYDETQNIQSYIFFDEADQTYPVGRSELLSMMYDENIFRDFGVIRPRNSINKIYWISATQEEMVLEYPECEISKQTKIEFQNGVLENHYSILDESAMVHTIVQPKDMENNDYLLHIINNNHTHFFSKMENGEYRKIIGLTSVENNSQKTLAQNINLMGANVILLNQDGIFLYLKDNEDITTLSNQSCIQESSIQDNSEDTSENTSDENSENTSQDNSENTSDENSEENLTENSSEFSNEESALTFRRRELDDETIKSRNQLIAKTYHETYPELKDAPLFILGNRKVDRGLTFHYAPISNDSYSFVLSDLIMGKISNWRRAVQAIGRGNGVIKHRLDFSGVIHYWIDPTTYLNVFRHCKMMNDDLLIKAHENPISYDVSEIVEILNEKYPNLVEKPSLRGRRSKYTFERSLPCDSYKDLCNELLKVYPDEKFRKNFISINGYFISTRLKKHFHILKKEDLTENHICTEKMLDEISWNKILYSNDMTYVTIPYYDDSKTNLKWIAIMKKKISNNDSTNDEDDSIVDNSIPEIQISDL